MASIIIAQLLFLQSESNKKPIHMYLNSPGVLRTHSKSAQDFGTFSLDTEVNICYKVTFSPSSRPAFSFYLFFPSLPSSASLSLPLPPLLHPLSLKTLLQINLFSLTLRRIRDGGIGYLRHDAIRVASNCHLVRRSGLQHGITLTLLRGSWNEIQVWLMDTIDLDVNLRYFD